MAFELIQNNWGSPVDRTLERITHEDHDRIRDILIGRRIVEVQGDQCQLDDGTVLMIVANEGCGGCPAGHYELDHLVTVDHAITNVEFDVEEDDDPKSYSERMTYKVFVFADAQKINAFSVSGDDGNGYYGTGYHIYVKTP